MARKRMISPSIWESSSFAKLSDLAKVVFIGLFSNADDDGKGYGDATFVKNKLFPRDKDKRVTDIEKALSEIAQTMSIIFYEVEGDKFYYLTKWKAYQKIDRPTPSKIPNPPETMGERGRTTQNHNFDEPSTNTRRILDEPSTTKYENNIKENNNISHSAGAREEDSFERKFKAFCSKWEIADDNYYSPLIADLDFDKLDKAYSESPQYLGDREKAPWAHTLSGVVKGYHSIISGKYKCKKKGGKQEKGQDTHDILQGIYRHYKDKEGNDGIE